MIIHNREMIRDIMKSLKFEKFSSFETFCNLIQNGKI